jgi:hypothetical protein
MKHQNITGKCDMEGCDKQAVSGNGVGAKLCRYHI